jgi:hypothetical protein
MPKYVLCDRTLEHCHLPECLAHGCMETSCDVTVWDDMAEGEIVKKLWGVTPKEADEVIEEFAGDLTKTVQVERR